MSVFLTAVLLASLLPTQLYPFSVHWNVPSETCLRNKVDLSLEKYGIKAHPGHIFYGENVVIFYEHSFGLYPYFKKHNKSHPVNGGLPQNTDLKAHLVEVEKNITKLIPNENFTGFGVIDIEEWRPLFEQHFRNVKQVYQEASIDRVRANHPNLNDAETRQRAESEFNEAAKKFIVETMKTAKKMRPKALWGIYGIPFCNYNAGEKDGDYSCSARYKRFNEKIKYIYEESAVLYPSIYLGFEASSEQRFRYVQAILMESLRLVKKYNPSLLVYPYSKFEYDPLKKLDSFYSSSDRCSTIDQPADLGIDGLILWSSSANMTKRCEKIKGYIETDLGPNIQRVIEKHYQCKTTMSCSTKQKCGLKKSGRRPPYPYTTTCASSKSNLTNYDDYECVL